MPKCQSTAGLAQGLAFTSLEAAPAIKGDMPHILQQRAQHFVIRPDATGHTDMRSQEMSHPFKTARMLRSSPPFQHPQQETP